jgi:MFS transporter, SHS family, lactate transporter
VIVPMARDFGTSVADLSYAITITLAMRPVGAFIFGLLGDRFGRRMPLMIDIIFYSLMELLTAFSPNFTVLLIFRALYGIGMGGEWGLGASLAMETLPTQARGLFSGILQQGYAFGYLLAAVVYWIVFPLFGWRGLFVAGALPAFLVLYIRARVPESPVWLRQQHAIGDFWRQALFVLKRHWALFLYVILLMTAFNAMSHGTQDMYQTFLGEQRHYGVTQKAMTGIIYAVGGNLRWNGGRPSLAKMGTSSVHCFVLCAWNRSDSPVGVFARIYASSDRRIRHAIHGPRRMGNCASALE